MNDFYVYMYLDQDNVPFYVGKGRDSRYRIPKHIKKSCPNRFLTNKILKVGINNIQIKFLYTNLSEEQAFYLEEYYIAGIGRRDLGLGPLCNLSNGGEGPSGRIPSKETRQKMSVAHTGLTATDETKQKMSVANKSMIFSIEHRSKLSKANKGRVPVNKGAHHSKEARRKMSIALKGKPSPNKGKSMTPEQKHKISVSCLLYFQKKKSNVQK